MASTINQVIPVLLGFTQVLAQPALVARPAFSIFQLKLIRYQLWEIYLPSDWIEAQNDDTISNWETGDKSKAMFCIVATSKPVSPEKMESAFQVMLKASEDSRKSLAGYQWEHLDHKKVVRKSEIHYVEEYYERSKGVRYFILIQITPTKVVRIAFHDYKCPDLKSSREYFSATVNSFKLREGTP